MANRKVVKESAKWRSGRDSERVVSRLASAGGGKMPHSFSNDERIAAEDNSDVMMPSRERASLEMVESEFSLEFLVGLFGAPALLEDTNDLLLAHATRQRRQSKFGRLRLTARPLRDKP